jgi:hypothetical protein
MGNTLASHSGDTGFKSRIGGRIISQFRSVAQCHHPVRQIDSRQLPSTSFSIHYSLIIDVTGRTGGATDTSVALAASSTNSADLSTIVSLLSVVVLMKNASLEDLLEICFAFFQYWIL